MSSGEYSVCVYVVRSMLERLLKVHWRYMDVATAAVELITWNMYRYWHFAKTVACRLDYCNSLFIGMSVSNFKSLQRDQNTLARVVLRRGKFERITPALIDLHWLPLHYRVTYMYKLATLTYSIKRSGQPSYLHELLQDYEPTYSVRSASHDLLATTRHKSIASRAFWHPAATAWNSVPFGIRNCDTVVTLKHRLKTFLFNQAFAI